MLAQEFSSSSYYVQKKKLGSGGSADVFLYGRRIPGLPEQNVVIKILKNKNHESLSELINEGARLSELKHPNVVITHGYEKVGLGHVGLVLEYVPGLNLGELLGKIGLEQRLELGSFILHEIIKGLQAAHQLGITHGDLTTRNILVSQNGDVKLSDFGLAKSRMSPFIEADHKGSIDYLAPERWSGSPAAPSSDIFSLGILAWEIATGRNPLKSDSLSGTREALDHFLSNEEWKNSGPWEKFFRGCFTVKPEERVSADKLLEFLPEPSLCSQESRFRLGRLVVTLDEAGSIAGATRKFLGSTFTAVFIKSQSLSWRRRFLVASVFSFCLITSAAIGMDHGTRGRLRPYLLTVTSLPWGEITIDGVLKGYTPIVNIPVPAGYHQFQWRNPNGLVVRRSVMAFENGLGGCQILKYKGQPLRIAPLPTQFSK